MSVSKGVDYGSYLNNTGVDGTLSVAFSGPQVGSTLYQSNNFEPANLQIDSANISGWDNYDGPFTWSANSGSGQLAVNTNTISSLFGTIVSGTMTDMMNMPAIITSGTVITYGFYDAGPGLSGLTNQDQCWVYCTRNLSTWMGDLTTEFPAVSSQPFYNFVLPGAHDSGMCTMTMIQQVLSELCSIISIAVPVLGSLSGSEIATTIMNAAITQKDSITTMLDVGCRYFDFRPGTMYPAIVGFSGIRYHQHSVVPGYPYIQFLEDVLNWLDENTTEIVVVSCNTQGFASTSMNPTASDLIADLQAAIASTNVSIVTGGATDLGSAYLELVQANKRLIFLNQIDGETTKYDSYSSSAYQTLSPSPIISALENMTTSEQANHTYTVLQLQGTASGCIGKEGFLSESLTSSPLMSTKLLFDSQTFPWVIANAATNLKAAQPIVLLNDFIDNGTVDIAIQVTLQRMNISGSF